MIDGLLKDVGMVGWAQTMTPEDAEAIRAYVNDRALALREAERGSLVRPATPTLPAVAH